VIGYVGPFHFCRTNAILCDCEFEHQEGGHYRGTISTHVSYSKVKLAARA
jgi:hypothetical protein